MFRTGRNTMSVERSSAPKTVRPTPFWGRGSQLEMTRAKISSESSEKIGQSMSRSRYRGVNSGVEEALFAQINAVFGREFHTGRDQQVHAISDLFHLALKSVTQA